ncbi:DUF4326 domain-containing protein [Bosea lathyri]|uniref:DUF4326 domain-containing protein n=1 Tax=Bosea lathyri TaxID=1036778 RepID=A0A1H6BEP9_9HYPH|nr:DUF4326 domain-containing protein [Bosea lathyri]SEG58825.1 protein of unknown function [Bosea lathyri]
MIKPVRLQLSRRNGFDLQAWSLGLNGLQAVKVTRPGPWGNPFNFRDSAYCWAALSYGCRADPTGRQEASVSAFREWIDPGHGMRTLSIELDPAIVSGERRLSLGPKVEVGRAPAMEEIRSKLRGRNLACWCRPGAPCHADVLVELANRPTCEALG